MDALLGRIYSVAQKNQFIEDFALKITFLNFNSEFLERKVQGLKSLTEIFRNVKFSNYKSIQLP